MKPIIDRTFTVCFICLCTLAFSYSNQHEEEKVLKAGTFASNITPALGGMIIGGWQPIPATHVHDDLHARCLVLDNGEMQMVFVVCDNLGLPRDLCDAAKKLIEERTGIPPQQVMISATHTHSAVTARGENAMEYYDEFTGYQQFIITRIADGVQTALHNLEPARIGWGSANEPSSVFNRRWFINPEQPPRNPFGGVDRVQMNPPRESEDLVEPAGPVDPEVVFLSVQSMDGDPIALLANYSLHYVGGVERGAVSADYFAIFAERIGDLLHADYADPPFVGMMSNGTSGDINNINFRKKSERKAPYEQMEKVADEVARVVYDAHRDIEFHDWVPLGVVQNELTLKVRKPTDGEVAYFRNVLNKPEDAQPYHRYERIYAKRVMQLHESPDEVEIILQTFRIGELGITTIPFEVFVEIGLELKEKNPFEESFTISLANGSYGYLPTYEQFELGGYETWMGTNKVEREASQKIVDVLLEALGELQGN